MVSLRKLLVVATLVFMTSRGVVAQMLTISFVVLLALLAQLLCAPFRVGVGRGVFVGVVGSCFTSSPLTSCLVVQSALLAQLLCAVLQAGFRSGLSA